MRLTAATITVLAQVAASPEGPSRFAARFKKRRASRQSLILGHHSHPVENYPKNLHEKTAASSADLNEETSRGSYVRRAAPQPLWAESTESSFADQTTNTAGEPGEDEPCDPDVGILACGLDSFCHPSEHFCVKKFAETGRLLQTPGATIAADACDEVLRDGEDCDCDDIDTTAETAAFTCVDLMFCFDDARCGTASITYSVSSEDDYSIIAMYTIGNSTVTYAYSSDETCEFQTNGVECTCTIDTENLSPDDPEPVGTINCPGMAAGIFCPDVEDFLCPLFGTDDPSTPPPPNGTTPSEPVPSPPEMPSPPPPNSTTPSEPVPGPTTVPPPPPTTSTSQPAA